jgi:hypothetical protein
MAARLGSVPFDVDVKVPVRLQLSLVQSEDRGRPVTVHHNTNALDMLDVNAKMVSSWLLQSRSCDVNVRRLSCSAVSKICAHY